jgi:hypothetical protein
MAYSPAPAYYAGMRKAAPSRLNRRVAIDQLAGVSSQTSAEYYGFAIQLAFRTGWTTY